MKVGRVGTPDDVAKAVEFLITNDFVTGTAIGEHYLDRWVMWNHVRTVAAIIAALLITVGLLTNAPM